MVYPLSSGSPIGFLVGKPIQSRTITQDHAPQAQGEDAMKIFFHALETLIPRMVVALIAWGIILILSHVTTLYFLELENPLWGWVLWSLIMSASVRPFMVSVPEITALVTINLVTGKLKSYETGLSFRYPWEQVKDGNYINLRLIPVDREEDYPAKDGPKMHAKWQVQFRVIDAVKYISVGREAIEEIVTAVGSSVLSAFMANHNAEGAKKEQKDLEKKLQENFKALKPEDTYGIEVPVVALADLDYEDIVQKVRSTQYVAAKLKKIAANLRSTDPKDKLKAKEALNDVMIIHGNVSKHINEVEGEGGNALAALLMAMSQGGGPRKENK